MIPDKLPGQIILHRSDNEYYTHVKHILENWNIELFEAGFRAEIRDDGIMETVPVVIALVSSDNFSGIDFLRSIMHTNNWIQRFMFSPANDVQIYERAVNKAHINYLLSLPPDPVKLASYLRKAQRRYENLTRPFAKFDALSDAAQELLLDNQKIRLEANTDPLTKLMNRRSFNNIFYKFWQRFKEKGTGFSMGILDLDHFKEVNDSCGHGFGDLVLSKIGEILLKNQRVGVDYAFRYGGEEFAMISLNTSADEMKSYIDRLRSITEKTTISDDEHSVSVTFSAGVSETQADQEPEQLIDQADKSLYQAKNTGRNRVLIYSPV